MEQRIGKFAEIIWEDAWADNATYYTIKSIREEGPFICKSVGIIIRDDANGTTLAREVVEDQYRGVQHIPAVMIREVRLIYGITGPEPES